MTRKVFVQSWRIRSRVKEYLRFLPQVWQLNESCFSGEQATREQDVLNGSGSGAWCSSFPSDHRVFEPIHYLFVANHLLFQKTSVGNNR
jgi:hypothetical protein